MPPDAKALSPEVQAARQAVAAEKLRAKKQAQAEINAQNREMKKQLAVLGPAQSMAAAIDAEAKAATPPPPLRSLNDEEQKQLAADIAKKQKRALKRVAASVYGSSDGVPTPPPRPGTAPGRPPTGCAPPIWWDHVPSSRPPQQRRCLRWGARLAGGGRTRLRRHKRASF